ncbi:MAG TPA: peptidylprolyl isomerase [Vicinamibacterales bacterium]|nr:peptidylprolyl isomerase [Vicinamibacterales bacterium]
MTMLDRMRRHKNWLKWSLAVVVLTFVLLYIPDFVQTTPTGTGAGPREVVAEINGRTVTAGDFQQRYLSQVQAYRQQFGGSMNDQLLRQLGIDQQILSQMIDEQVGLIEAEQNGIGVSDDELAQQIFSIPALQENGRFIGEQRYEQLLLSQNPPMTKQQFEESLRRSMLLDKLRAALTDWMAVSDSDVQREYNQRNEKVKLQVVALTEAKFRGGVTVTDADIASRFEAHKAEYRMGEQRKIKYILLDREQARLKVSVPPSDVQRHYNDNIQQYQTPEQVKASHILLKTDGKDEATVRKQAEEVLKEVKAGGDFAALAKKYSEDEGSKANGGDLDYFGRGRMVPEFENVAFTLPPGQVSDLVKSQFGFHIIKVIDKRPGATTPLDQVRSQIQDQLALQLADQRISDQAAQYASRIKDLADLQPVARELQIMVQESGYFQRENPVPGLGAAPQVASTAFTLQGTAASAPLPTARGPVFIAVSERKDPYIPMLDEVKERVREDLIKAKATEASREKASTIAAALKSAKDFSAAAKAQGLEAKDTELVARGSALPDVGVSPEVERVAFSLPAGSVSDPIQTTDGTAIIRVVEKDDVTPDELRQAQEAFRAELLNERRSRFFAAYMGKAKEKMRVEIKSDVLRRVLAAYKL